MLGFFRRRSRKKLQREPFPDAWRTIIERNAPLFTRLPEPLQKELFGHVRIFLHEKHFEGAGGLELTDEIRVTIAAQACVLLLGRPTDYYPDLQSIVVYPSGYRVPERRLAEGGVVFEGTARRLGESWSRGLVVLSWDDALSGARSIDDGHNLVFHEFAHQLDQESGDANGAPVLADRRAYQPWARVLGREYQRLVAGQDRYPLIDEYGATSPAEFFAVLTELYFERPHALQRRHPELYAELMRFYQLDPRSFLDA